MDGFKPQKRPLSPQGTPEPPIGTPIKPTQTPIVSNADLPSPVKIEPSQSLLEIKNPKKSKKKLILGIIGGFLLVIVIAIVAAFMWYKTALSPVDASDKTRQRVDIVTGSSPADIAQLLLQKKLIRSDLAFDIYTRLSGTRSALQAGTYNLSASESTEEIVSHLTSGKVDEFSLTFLPGATLAENRKVLIKAGYQEAEVDAALAKSYDHPLLTGKPATADLEGYIYGETYNFNSSATVEEILEKTFDEYYSKIRENNLISGFKAQGLSLYEGITLASIVQREEPNPEDQKQVAQVFFLRMAEGMTLGSDVTAYYGVDKIGVSRSVGVDTPYNTRIHVGLPPGPIATPGLTALQAVASPAAGDYLFFLSGDDDVTYYARTDAEHQANIQNHCHVKCAIP